MNEISRSPNGADKGNSWAKADLFFLEDSLRRGMSLAEIAGFLGRTADEVREKVEQVTPHSCGPGTTSVVRLRGNPPSQADW